MTKLNHVIGMLVTAGLILGGQGSAKTQAIFIDSDRDRWSDASEREAETDPFDAASFPESQSWTAEVDASSPELWFRFEVTDPAAEIPSQGSVSQGAFYGFGMTSEHLGIESVGDDFGNAVDFTGPPVGADSDKNIDLAAEFVPALTALRGGSLEPKTTSVELWIKTSQNGSSGNNHNASPVLLGNASEGDGQIYWGWINGDGDFGMTTSGMQEIQTERDAGIEVTDGEWHHIVMIKKWRVDEPSESIMIVDGGDRAGGATISAQTPAGAASYQDDDATIRFFGVLQDGQGDDVQFIGQVDELAIYSRALSESEARLHFLSGMPDSDGDQIIDRLELAHGLDPDVDDAADDLDGDGLPNIVELFESGTDPNESDTDGDGLADGVETGTGDFAGPEDTGTDPNNSDTDGDGLDDGVETATGEFVGRDNTGTDPNQQDTDGDGYPDATEVTLGASPVDGGVRPVTEGAVNLLAFWDFNERGSENGIADAIHGIAGEMRNGAALTADGEGASGESEDRAIDFGTTSEDQLFSVEEGAFLNAVSPNDTMTLSFWQRWHTEPVNSSSFWLISPSSDPPNQRGAQAHVPWSNGSIFFDTAGCCGGDTRLSEGIGSFEDADGVEFFQDWHHFAFVKNGPTKQIWIDGNLFAEGQNPEPLPGDFQELFLGVRPQNVGDGQEGIHAAMDDFAVFASHLSSLEIEALAQGTRPQELDNDEDDDGIPDLAEETLGLDASDPSDGEADLDGDGITNAEEFQTGTDIENDDTDGDGLVDGVETDTGTFVSADDTGTDPNDSDSDGDGLEDGVESNSGEFGGPSDTGTDPNVSDTDGDGANDGAEVALDESGLASDPTDPESLAIRPGEPNLLAFWNFNATSNGSEVEDEANGFLGSLENGAELTENGGGHSGEAGDRAVDFGTTSEDQLVRVADAGFLNGTSIHDQMTVSFWQKWNTPTVNGSTFWMLSPSSSGNNRGAQSHLPFGSNVFFDTAGCCNGATQRLNGDIASFDDAEGGEFFLDWHHFTFVKDGVNKEIWIDGKLFLEGENTAPLPDDFTELLLGVRPHLIGEGQEGIHAVLDDFAVFAGGLRPLQIRALAQGASPQEMGDLPDSDGDGMPDIYEQEVGLDPSVDDADGDEDGDGLANLAEFERGTDPNSFDTDSDGLADGVESGTGEFVDASDTGTDPTNPDTDGDGLVDGLESGTGEFVSGDDTGTDPNNPDSDGDGLNDGVETNSGTFVGLADTGTNPVSGDTDGDGVGDREELFAGFDPNIAESVPEVTDPPESPEFSRVELQEGELVLEWTNGTLQSADQAAGPYENIEDANSPHNISVGDRAQQFFRLAQ